MISKVKQHRDLKHLNDCHKEKKKKNESGDLSRIGPKRNKEVLQIANDSPHSERLLNLCRSETECYVFVFLPIYTYL